MMGVYFAATGLGNKVAGIIGESASDLGEYSVFLGILIFTVIIGNIYDVAKTIKSINSRC
jgi:POT family proton-dependent oligopeptide transporter